MKTSVRRILGSAVALVILASPLRATWSIIVANLETREVGIGSATCLGSADMKATLAVIVPARGAAQFQSGGDLGNNRPRVFNWLNRGRTAHFIMERILADDPNIGMEQIGIVDMFGNARTHTGRGSGPWAGGATGRIGSLVYAIQGNVMVGEEIITDSIAALTDTPGDLSQKLMAAMEAIRAVGGDKRCNVFGKSAHVAYMAIARVGDDPGDHSDGWADGDHWMDLEFLGGVQSQDPVLKLQRRYNRFRRELRGHPDQIHTRTHMEPPSIEPNSSSVASLVITLRDIDIERIHAGGHGVTIRHHSSSDGVSTIGSVLDHGDGTYSVSLQAGLQEGRDVFEVVIDDGVRPVTLFPYPVLEVESHSLRLEQPSLSGRNPEPLTLVLDGGRALGQREFLLLAGASGSRPGLSLAEQHIPLNPDLLSLGAFGLRLFRLPPEQGGGEPIPTPGTGRLDECGRAHLVFDPEGLDLRPLIGGELSFSWFTLSPTDFVSPPVRAQVLD